MSSSAKSIKNKCSFGTVQSQKRLKAEEIFLNTNILETEQKLPIINDDVENKTLTRSMRVQKQSPDKITNVLNKEKGKLKFGEQNSESKVTFINCTKTFISENIAKNLDDIFFSEEREDQNSLDLAKLPNDNLLIRKDIQQAKEITVGINSDSMEKNNDQVQKESKPDEHFGINKSVSSNISLYGNKKEDSNKEKNSTDNEANIIFDNKKNDNKCEANTENNLKDISKMNICEGNSTIEDDYSTEYKDNLKEQIENKLLVTTEKQDDGENLDSDKICKNTEENIQPQVLEIISTQANDASLFQQSTTPILIDQLHNDIRVTNEIIIQLSRAKNLENNTVEKESGYPNTFEGKSLPLTINYISGNVKEKINKKFALNYNQTDGKQLSTQHETENDDKHALKEIFNKGDVQKEKSKIHLVGNPEMLDENSEAKQKSLHDMILKSEETALQTKNFSLNDLNARKNEQIHVKADKEAYFNETNTIFIEDKSETKQLLRQNSPIISNSMSMSNEETKQENKEFDFSNTENETDETKVKTLTLFYVSALDYVKDYQIKDGIDRIESDSKEIEDFNINKDLKNSVNVFSQNFFSPISKQSLNTDLPNNTVQKEVNDLINVKNEDQEKHKILNIEKNVSENYKDNSIVREDNISNLVHDLCDSELEKYGEIRDNNKHNNKKCDLDNDIITLNMNENMQKAAKFSYNDKELPLSQSTIKNLNCNHKSENFTEKNVLEEKQIKIRNENCKSKRNELEERSFLITATDYFKTEIIKETEFFKESEKFKANENVTKTDGNSAIIQENERNSYLDPEDSFAMDDDFDLTASQLSMIEIDERNHFKESKERKVDSIQQTENCLNTHFNQDSVTVEIIDQLFYIRESVESIKESLNRLLKSKDTAT